MPVGDVRAAEMTKLLENTFRHVNIALVNELAIFAHQLGIDIWEVIDAAATKPFGFMRFTPGPGVGGHCLPIDPSYLSWRVSRSLGQPFRFIDLANDINDHMPDYVVRRLMVAFNERCLAIRGRRIVLVGLAYKSNTADARQSPSIPIAQQLLSLGADVVGVDPLVDGDSFTPHLPLAELTPELLRGADATVVLANHDGLDLHMIARHARYVLDTRNCLPCSPRVERL